MASTSSGFKAATGLLTGLVLLLVTLLANAYAKAANHISTTDAQEMVDRGDETVKELLMVRLDGMDKKLDQLIAAQGQSP